MHLKLNIDVTFNIWKVIVIGQVAIKALKLGRAIHRARVLGKNKVSEKLIEKFDDL